MRISATGSPTTKTSAEQSVAVCATQGGFSLLELLMVVLIIGLGVAVVSLVVGNDRPQELRSAAREFANLTALVEEEAILSRDIWGVQLYRVDSNDGGSGHVAYRWLRLRAGWQVEAPRELAAGGRFPDNVEAVLEVEGAEQLIEPLPKDKAETPTIWLAPGGEVTPFQLRLRFAGSGAAGGFVVRSDALGRIDMEKDGDEQ